MSGDLIERLRDHHCCNASIAQGNPYGCNCDEAADLIATLEAREAELVEHVQRLGGGCEANGGGEHSMAMSGKDPFCPDCGLMLKRVAYVLPHVKPRDVRKALARTTLSRTEGQG